MDANSMDRKEFFVLTFTLIGSAVAGAAACSSSSNNTDGGGGSGGGTGVGGAGGGAGGGGAGGETAAACTDPLPETQEPDNTQHTHTVTISAATLNSTTDQTFTTSPPMPNSDGHMHMITTTVAQLATLKGGGTVTAIMSTPAGTPTHTHKFDVTCH
jgi:hypothetical protein